MSLPEWFKTSAFFLALALSFVVTGPVGAQQPADPPEPQPAASGTAAPDSSPTAALRAGELVADRLALIRFEAEQLWLETADAAYLVLYRPPEAPIPFGGLVISGGPGSIVDNASVLRALAEAAAAGGWSVLSVHQAGTDDNTEAAALRIVAAVARHRAEGLENVVVVADADGAPAALQAIALNPGSAVVGFVGIGAWDADLAGTDIAILDIAGTRDRRALRHQRRRVPLKRVYPNIIETQEVDGAGPDFYGYEDQTAQRIRGWLLRAAPAATVTRREPGYRAPPS